MPLTVEEKASEEDAGVPTKEGNNNAPDKDLPSGIMANGHYLTEDMAFLALNVFDFGTNKNVWKVVDEEWCCKNFVLWNYLDKKTKEMVRKQRQVHCLRQQGKK